MKKLQTVAALIVATSMGIGSLAVAQDRGRDNDNRGGPRASESRDGASRWDGRDARNDRPAPPQFRNDRGPDPRGYDRRGDDRRADNGPRGNGPRGEWRGAGPDHRFHRGDRLPQYYRSRQYVVEDWRGHRLSAPPRGYQWVQTGGDYVLAAIATGVILQILLNQ